MSRDLTRSGVTRGRGRGRAAAGDTTQEGDTVMKVKIFLADEFTRTLDWITDHLERRRGCEW